MMNGNESNEIMPPVAPSYKDEQQAFNRLMDSVHKNRIEDVHIGKDTVEICLEDAHVVQGAIEIRARVIPKPEVHPLIPAPSYQQPGYSYPYSNQFHPQYSYQYQNPSPPQYSYQHPYPYQYQNPALPQYSYQYPCPYQYQNPVPLQYQYPYQYPSQLPTQYLYQYPLVNAAGSITSALSQLVLTANLLRR